MTTPDAFRLVPEHSALVLMDFQNDVLDRNLDPAERKALLSRVEPVLRAARSCGMMVVHVMTAFRAGYPEVSPHDQWRRNLSGSGRLQEGSPGAMITSELAPLPGEITVTKRRTDPFSTTDLTAVLRARGIHQIVTAGVSTGGSVLSTIRAAADLDLQIVVLGDGCADPDPEVHRVLCEKVFPRQATVIDTGQMLGDLTTAQGPSPADPGITGR